MAEDLVFDPGASPLSIMDGSDGIELVAHAYPAPPLEVQWAGSVDTEGELPASRRYGNRRIDLTVVCRTSAALRALQAKAAKVGAEGGVLEWTLPGGEKIAFDLLAHQGFEPGFGISYHALAGGFCSVDIGLAAKPFGRGAEVDLGSNSSSAGCCVFHEDVPGDVPALGRLRVTDTTNAAAYWLAWGRRRRVSASASRMVIEPGDADATLGSGVTIESVGGTTSGTVARQASLATSHTDILSVSPLNHVGAYRAFARVKCPNTNGGTVTVALAHLPPGRTTVVSSQPATFDPAWEGDWHLLDLGMVTIAKPPPGSPLSTTWALIVTAASTNAGDDIDLDQILLFPTDGFGVARGDASDVAFANNGWIEIRSDGAVRSSVGGASVGSVPLYEGDYLLVPPGAAELIVRPADGVPTGAHPRDNILFEFTARLYVTPRWLVVPTPPAP